MGQLVTLPVFNNRVHRLLDHVTQTKPAVALGGFMPEDDGSLDVLNTLQQTMTVQ